MRRARQRRAGQYVGRQRPLGEIVDTGEVVAPPASSEPPGVDQRLERDLAVVPIPPRTLGTDPLLELARHDWAVVGHEPVHLLDVVGAGFREVNEPRPPVRHLHRPSVEVIVVGRYERGLVHPVLEHLPGVAGVGHQGPRVGPEAGEQWQLLAADEDVH